jgi:sulfofructose kinase
MSPEREKPRRALSFDAVGVGLTCYDLAALIERWPEGDRGKMLEYTPAGGGMCSNAIICLQRLGARCALATCVGDDDPGRFLVQDLRAEGVDTTFVRVARGGRTQVSLNISVRGTDDKTLLALPQRSLSLKPGGVGRDFWTALAKSRLLHLDGFYPELALFALDHARKSGVMTSLDITHADENAERLVRGADIVFAPVEFVEAFFGHRHFERAAVALSKMGPRWAGVTLGEYGSIGVAGDQVIRQPAFNVEAVDTVGAGDAFHGGIAFAALQGWDLPRALRFASATAAICCTALSPRAPLPTLRQTQRFLKKHANQAHAC